MEPTPSDSGPNLEEVIAAARAEGFAAGYREGLQQIRETHRRSTRRLVRLARHALVDADQLNRSVEREVVELSVAVAEKVIEREIQIEPDTILAIVRAALKEMQRAPISHVRVHPEDQTLLTDHWDEVLPAALAGRVQLVADEEIERGGCVVEMRHGQADAQPRTKLAQISEVFEALLEGESA
jgi:flagellar biosynthesis/type III secretory pathway protein FliH